MSTTSRSAPKRRSSVAAIAVAGAGCRPRSLPTTRARPTEAIPPASLMPCRNTLAHYTGIGVDSEICVADGSAAATVVGGGGGNHRISRGRSVLAQSASTAGIVSTAT